jgi:hypothetical protein
MKDNDRSSRKELLAEISREEQRLAELRSLVEKAEDRLHALREELGSVPSVGEGMEVREAPHRPWSASNSEKISLFRSLFRGREDVFPKYWENPRAGKSGYSPACANEWDDDLCEKKKVPRGGRSRITCGNCPNQAFLPVTDEEIASHLKGLQVMGVYPLLKDETCWFLAADFDKESWHDDDPYGP